MCGIAIDNFEESVLMSRVVNNPVDIVQSTDGRDARRKKVVEGIGIEPTTF